MVNGPSTNTANNITLYNADDGGPNGGSSAPTKATVTLTANKTHYLVGDKIGVDVNITKTHSSRGFGTVRVVMVSDDWVNQHNNQHAIYSSGDIALVGSGATSGSYSTDDITTFSYHNNGLAPDASKLHAGRYTIMLIHRLADLKEKGNSNVTLAVKDFLKYKDLREKFLLVKIPIYIHDPDESVEFSIVHDEGEYTYFSDASRQFESVGADRNANADHIYTLTDPFRNDDLRAITATVNVTNNDVKRGYIVLNANYTGLWSANEHTKEKCQSVNGTTVGVAANAANHNDNTCVCQKSGDDSTFKKIIKGQQLYEIVKNYYNNDAVSKKIVHEGIDYTVKFSLGPNALVRKTTPMKLDMSIMTAPSGYANAVFTNTVNKEQSYELKLDPILNPPIKKGNFNFDGGEKFAGSYLSVPKTYFNVGEPITVDYKVAGASGNVYMYITSDQICSGGKYGDLYIKQAQVNNNSNGTIQFTADTYNLSDATYTSTPLVDAWKNNIAGINELRKLPEGEYKIWLINSDSFHPFEVLFNTSSDNHLVTEPISIKVIDPANPDISIIHRDNIPYQNDSEIIPTELILDKVVYEQGEPIYFKINGSWVRNRVCILKDDVFYTYNIKAAMESANQTRYAQHGTYYELVQKYKDNSNLTKDYRNFLNTEGLPPGQYKIVYLFGEELEKAWRHTVFGNPHNAAKSRVITIIDITILPNDAVENHLAYTKTDGTQDKIALPELSLPQSIKEPTYTLTTLTETEYNAIYNTAKYSSNLDESYNYGTKDSLKYRFDNYKVKPAEITYTVTAPADVNTCTCNLTYYYTLLNCGERKRFNLLCPSYSFTKIEN